MDGQMTIFDFIETEEFCPDKDINELVSDLKDLCRIHQLRYDKPKYSVWKHVPRLGYRLWFTIQVKRDTDIYEDMNALIEKYDKRGIELSAMWGAVWFLSENNEEASLYVSTMFKDKRKNCKYMM